MTDRVLLSADRLIISRPGHSATDPNLADVNKVIDSNWLFGSGIVMCEFVEIQTGATGGVWTINFPQQNYVPAAVLYSTIPPWADYIDIPDCYMIVDVFNNRYTRYAGQLHETYGAVRIYNNRIEIDQPPSGWSASNHTYYRQSDQGNRPQYFGITAIVFGV